MESKVNDKILRHPHQALPDEYLKPQPQPQNQIKPQLTNSSRCSTVMSNQFDLNSFKSSPIVASEHDYTNEDLKDIGNLAEVFLDTKRAFLNDNNILNSEKVPEVESQQVPSSKISRATLIRVERVKTGLALNYLAIERICNSEIQYPGIDGVYNPLQIIRNRKLRSKYHEAPKPLSVKTLPLACNVFSKHNIYRDLNSKKRWKLLWSIELNELVSDQAWRRSHIHELKNSKGDLWFPPSGNSLINSKERTKRVNLTRRLHDRLFNDDDESVHASSERKLGLDLKIGKRDRLKERVKRSFRYAASSSSSLEEFVSKRQPSFEELILQDQDTSQEVSENEENLNKEHLHKVVIKPVRESLESFIGEESDNQINIETHTTTSKNNHQIVDQQLSDISEELNLLRESNHVKNHYLTTVYPKIEESINIKLNTLVTDTIPRLNNAMIDINDDGIPTYELYCSTLLNEIKSLRRTINDDYSVRIDNLLTGTDRLTGEITTSMTLELRKIDEQLDRLHNSLFFNLVSDALNRDFSGDSNYRMLYFLLENFIVIVLRLIWVVVNVFRVLIWGLIVIYKIIRVFI